MLLSTAITYILIYLISDEVAELPNKNWSSDNSAFDDYSESEAGTFPHHSSPKYTKDLSFSQVFALRDPYPNESFEDNNTADLSTPVIKDVLLSEANADLSTVEDSQRLVIDLSRNGMQSSVSNAGSCVENKSNDVDANLAHNTVEETSVLDIVKNTLLDIINVIEEKFKLNAQKNTDIHIEGISSSSGHSDSNVNYCELVGEEVCVQDSVVYEEQIPPYERLKRNNSLKKKKFIRQKDYACTRLPSVNLHPRICRAIPRHHYKLDNKRHARRCLPSRSVSHDVLTRKKGPWTRSKSMKLLKQRRKRSSGYFRKQDIICKASRRYRGITKNIARKLNYIPHTQIQLLKPKYSLRERDDHVVTCPKHGYRKSGNLVQCLVQYFLFYLFGFPIN